MLKASFSALALVAITCGLATSASAQQGVVCSSEFKKIWDMLGPNGPAAKLTDEQFANTHRSALRAYDACMAGDESFAKEAFAKIGQHLRKNER